MNFSSFLDSEYANRPHLLLLGNPVSHSYSPMMHNAAADYYGLKIRYHAVRLESQELNRVAAHFNSELFKGANVTIPYKVLLKDFVDELDADANRIGAVNTIAKTQRRIQGYNTDTYGFGVPLQRYRAELEGGRALIFGTGGATRAILQALHNLHIQDIILISRNPSRKGRLFEEQDIRIEGYESWTAFAEQADIIINATPLGMEPNVESCPIRENELEFLSGKICYDIVYKPLETKFLKYASQVGGRTISGLEMLLHQGSKSFEIWTGNPFPVDVIKKKLYDAIQ